MSNAFSGEAPAFTLGVVMLMPRLPRLIGDIGSPAAFAYAVTGIVLLDFDGMPGAGR